MVVRPDPEVGAAIAEIRVPPAVNQSPQIESAEHDEVLQILADEDL